MKLSKKEKELISERINISLATFYNWEKSKPELIKLLLLGLEKENEDLIIDEKKELIKDIDIEKLFETVMDMKEELEHLKSIQKNK